MGLQLINTGIDGLDRLLGGGIPKGSTVLVSGPPGAGKTVMSLEYTFKQAKKGQRVLFVSTCELLYSINRFASSLAFFDLGLVRIGMNIDFYGPKEEGGFVEFWDYSLGPLLDEQYAGDIFDVIQEKVSLHKIDHLVIDTISSINMFMGDEAERRKKLLLFMGWASRSGCTTILTAEGDGACPGMERFLADGVIDLASEVDDEQALRTIQVAKLRGQHHMSGRYYYTITQEGVKVLAPGLGEQPPQNLSSTGIEDLDANIGGMADGSAWLFNVLDADAWKPLLDAVLKAPIAPDDLIMYIHRGPGADIPGDRVTMLCLDKPIDLSRECGKKRCRIVLSELYDSPYMETLGYVKAHGGTLITFAGSACDISLRETAGRSSDGVVDVWNSGGYTLLRVMKAPYAQSFETYALKLQDGRIRLIPL